MAVPKYGGPWDANEKYEGPQSHQAKAEDNQPGKKGKGSSKGNRLKIIKVIHKVAKKTDGIKQLRREKSAQKGGWKHQEDKEVQTLDIQTDQTTEKEGIVPPPMTKVLESEEEVKWDICESEWETEGNGNQQGSEQGPWEVEGIRGPMVTSTSGVECMEDTEGEE